MPSPTFELTVLRRTTLSSDAVSRVMPEPLLPTAMLASMRLRTESPTAMPPALPRSSLPSTTVAMASSRMMASPIDPSMTLSTTRVAVESITETPNPPFVVIVLPSMRLPFDGSSSSPTEMPPPRLPSSRLPTISLSAARVRTTARPPDRVISLASTRLPVASSIHTASPEFDVNTLSATTVPRVPAVRWMPCWLPLTSLSRMVLPRPLSSESDSTTPASAFDSITRPAEHVGGHARVELHADSEVADRAIGDGDAVVARVEDAGAFAGAIQPVTVEVDGDVRARRRPARCPGSR